MANSSILNLLAISAIFVTFFALTISPSTVDASEIDDQFSWMSTKPATCSGSMAECMATGEFEMDTESNRRILATTSSYISYGALQADNGRCPHRGSSYYNCVSGGEANPYNRGCSTLTRCKR